MQCPLFHYDEDKRIRHCAGLRLSMNVKDLYKHYQDCTLTRGQDLAVRAPCDFFNSQDQVFMPGGCTGSGKTFCSRALNQVMAILRELKA